jgi:hypothetical protein
MFAEDLINAYPDAKVILTNRDVDKWWTSFCNSIGSVVTSRRYRLAGYLDPQGLGAVSRLGKLIVSVILGPLVTEAEAKARFAAHYEKVRKIVPKESILEYEVAEGWKPLCAFLGKDVPALDFPHTNDAKMFRERAEATTSVIFGRFAVKMVLPCLLITGVALAMYTRADRK